jgi:hypothetical protein
MKFGGQGIFDNAVFLVGTSARKPGFPRLYKTKDHELSRIRVRLDRSRWIELLLRQSLRGNFVHDAVIEQRQPGQPC